MNINFPWSRIIYIKCPDGTPRMIYRSIDDACPLYIKGWTADAAAGIKGLADLSGEARVAYGAKIEGLLFNLTEQNQSLMMSFRTIYLALASNPCGAMDFFQRELDKLLDEQRKMTALKLHISALLELAKTNPGDSVGLTRILADIASHRGESVVPQAASMAIADSRADIKQLFKES